MRDHNWVSKSAKLGGSNRYQRDAVLGGATCLKYNDCLYCADCSMGGEGGGSLVQSLSFLKEAPYSRGLITIRIKL